MRALRGLETKAFEIRDVGTFIPVIATQLTSTQPDEAYLLGRTGYPLPGDSVFVLVTRLKDGASANDPYNWGNRTMLQAHMHIQKHFADLPTGAVIDVEYILGESAEPKISERLEVGL